MVKAEVDPMTLSFDIRHVIASHTANQTVLERAIRLSALMRQYQITDPADWREAARIAAVREEDT